MISCIIALRTTGAAHGAHRKERFHQLPRRILEYIHMNNFKSTIDKALERQTILEIEYKDKKKAISKRLILPMYWDDDSIIVAFCFLREDDRHFNINNIISAIEAGEDAISRLPQSLRPRKVEFPPNKHFGELFIVEDLDRTLLFPYDYEVNIKRGKVLVPPNKNLFLSATEIQRGTKYIQPDITVLRNFQKEDLQAFEVGHITYKMDLENIKHFSDLKWVSLNHPSRKNLEDLYQIESNLTYLFLTSGIDRDSMRGMEFVPPFIGLKALELGYIDLQDTDLIHINTLEKLEFLTLSGNKEFTGTGLMFISDKAKLWHLDLQSTNIDDDGVCEIVKFTNLKDLSLAKNKNPNLTKKGLVQLEFLKNLQSLDLHGTNLDDDSFQKICNLTNLEVLWMGMTRVSDKGMKFIENLRNLTQLNIYDTQITEKGLEHIGKLPNLKYLQIEDEKKPSKT